MDWLADTRAPRVKCRTLRPFVSMAYDIHVRGVEARFASGHPDWRIGAEVVRLRKPRVGASDPKASDRVGRATTSPQYKQFRGCNALPRSSYVSHSVSVIISLPSVHLWTMSEGLPAPNLPVPQDDDHLTKEDAKNIPPDAVSDYIDHEKSQNRLHLNEASRHVTAAEHRLSLPQALATYPKIAAWCMFLCLPIIGLQYDQTVMGAYYALPAFQHKYGRLVDGKYIVPAQWQSAISMAGYLGQILGSIGVSAWPLERFGPRWTLSVAVGAVALCNLIQFLAPSIEVLFVGELLQGTFQVRR